MTGEAWNDRSRRSLGVLLDGEAIAERGARGERITGDTLLVLLNAGPADVVFTLPPHRIAVGWDLLVDTTSTHQADERVPVGGQWTAIPHSAAVFREAR
jgi:glycogen operon protein